MDEPSPAVEKPSPAVEEPSPAAAATSAPIKTRPLTQTSPPAEAVSTPAETAPIAAATPRGATKMGNTGSLVNQEEKVQPGCLCFSAPGSKKGKKQKETIGTDAPIYAGPAATGTVTIELFFTDHTQPGTYRLKMAAAKIFPGGKSQSYCIES